MMSENRVLFENRSYVRVQIMEGKLLLFNVENRLRRNGCTHIIITNYIVRAINDSKLYKLVEKTVIINNNITCNDYDKFSSL